MAARPASPTLRAVRRVPLLIVFPLCAAAIAVPWWWGTRNVDFMTPPTEQELAHIREQTLLTFPGRAHLFSASQAEKPPEPAKPVVPEPIKPPPAIDPGEEAEPPTLNAYAEYADKGAAAFIELAIHLEGNGHAARALTAWERVLDVCKQPDDEQRQTALDGVQRLRPGVPAWNTDPQAAIPLVMEIVIPAKAATAEFKAAAKAVADDLGVLSSGLLHFEAKVTPLKKQDKSKGMSLRIRGAAEGSPVSGTFQLDAMPPSQQAVNYQLYSGTFKLAASQLVSSTEFAPPSAPPDATDIRAALEQRITRLGWREFGKSLQRPKGP